MIDIVTKGGKKIGRLTDSFDEDDYIVIQGKKVLLTDAYGSDNIKQAFNDEVKGLKDDSKSGN